MISFKNFVYKDKKLKIIWEELIELTSKFNYLKRILQSGKFYLYGGGWCGEVFYEIFCKPNNLYPKAVLDKYAKENKTKFDGLLKKFDENDKSLDKNFPVIVTIYKKSTVENVKKTLLKFGFKEVIIIPQDFWADLLLIQHMFYYLINKYFIKKFFDRNKAGYVDLVGVRLDLLGDFFIFLPFFLEYLERYKKHLFIVNSFHEEIVKCFTKNYLLIEKEKFTKNLFYKTKIFKNLANYLSQKGINFITYRGYLIADELIANLNSKEKIYYKGDFEALANLEIFQKLFEWYDSFYNKKILSNVKNLNKIQKSVFLHSSEYEKDYFYQLTLQEIQNLRIFYEKAYDRFKRYIINNKLSSNYICIITDASQRYKIYPQEKWQKLLNMLPKDWKVVQLGIRKMPLFHPNLIDLTGKTTLKEAMQIVTNAKLVIGNDTGLMHFAYLSGVPTVCILGGGHFGRLLPWKEFEDKVKPVYKKMDCFCCNWQCKYLETSYKAYPCIEKIEPEDILKTVEVLNEGKK